uniref:Uncharacterized protein n=1 Tax=Caenorhabditis japonica TaxID=281687 RepID=A0A8R1IL57_CAEJA
MNSLPQNKEQKRAGKEGGRQGGRKKDNRKKNPSLCLCEKEKEEFETQPSQVKPGFFFFSFFIVSFPIVVSGNRKERNIANF